VREVMECYLADLGSRFETATVRGARIQLARFLRDAVAVGFSGWSDIDTLFVACWVEGLHKQGLSPGTLGAYVSRLRHFFRWLVREGVVLANPVSANLSGPVPRPVIRPPDAATVARAIDRADVSRNNVERNRAMMELMYLCGLRRSEVSGLDLRDVRGDDVRVLGKGRKERLVPLGESAGRLLRDYVSGERAMIVGRHGECEALFLSMYGGRMGSMGVYMALKHSMGSTVNPHMLRRACATHMLRNGAPVEVLRRLLGHDRLSTTEFYTDVSAEDVRREMVLRHPGW